MILLSLLTYFNRNDQSSLAQDLYLQLLSINWGTVIHYRKITDTV